MNICKIAFSLMALLSTWAPIEASALRCQGRIVSLGETRYEVTAKCGAPSFVEQRYEERLGIPEGRLFLYDPGEKRYIKPWAVQQVLIEEWTYNFGPHSLMYYLRFENGILNDIRTGDYGF
ncbi:MAG: DUF2845 domain-containing protein [bacterium]